jgi:hypothetical protein
MLSHLILFRSRYCAYINIFPSAHIPDGVLLCSPCIVIRDGRLAYSMHADRISEMPFVITRNKYNNMYFHLYIYVILFRYLDGNKPIRSSPLRMPDFLGCYLRAEKSRVPGRSKGHNLSRGNLAPI